MINYENLLSQNFIDKIKSNRELPSTMFKNVYMFPTEACNLKCSHCYMGQRLDTPLSMSLDKCLNWLKLFKDLGGEKLCFLGGEATLYPHLFEAISYANKIGYKEIIVATNATNVPLETIMKIPLSSVSAIQTSIEGVRPETHDMIRGKGTFEQTINSLKVIKEIGFETRVVYTVSKSNLDEAIDVLDLLDELGVSLIKYHIFSDIGNGKDIADSKLSVSEWIGFVNKLRVLKGKYKIKIQFQNTYEPLERLNECIEEGYKGCIGKEFDRISVLPNGEGYICSCYFDVGKNSIIIKDSYLDINERENEMDDFFEGCNVCSKDVCLKGCPAGDTINEANICNENENIYPVCRLWKTTV